MIEPSQSSRAHAAKVMVFLLAPATRAPVMSDF
jgi:hypothetical protein